MAKYIGFGTLLKATTTVAAGTTPTEAIAQIESMDGPDASRAEIDVTTLDSTAKEYRVGPREGGTMTLGVTWDPVTPTTSHQWLKNRYDDGQQGLFRIEWPGSSGTAITFRGYVSSFSPSFPMEDKIVANVNVKVTDAITWPT